MALSHVLSSPIADFTGTVTVFNSAGATTTANATQIVRPSDWNSAHNEYVTLSGNTAGVSTMSGTNIVLQGGNRVVLSGTGQSIIISASDQSVQTQNMVSVGGSTGAIVFANSNGITFGGNASTITASHNGLTTAAQSDHTHSQYLTTAAQSNHSHGNPTLNLTNLSGTTASNSAGLTLSLSAAAPSAVTLTNYATGNTVLSSSGTIAGSSIVMRGSGGVSAGISNGSYVLHGPDLTSLSVTGALSASSNGSTISLGVGTVTASAASNTVTTNANSSGTVNLNALVFQGVGGASVGFSNGSIVISGNTGGGAGGAAISGGANSQNTGTVNFANSNGITFGLSNNGTMTASHNGLTTAALSNHSHGVSFTSGSVGFQTLSFTNSNGISFDSGTQGIFASHNALTSQSNQAVSNSAGSFTFQTLNFSNANNVTFGTSAGGIITASVAAPGAASVTGISGIGVSDTTYSSGTVIYSAQANVTLGSSVDGASQYVRISVAAPGAGMALANSETTYTSGTANMVVAGGAMTIASTTGQSFRFSVPATSSLVAGTNITISTNGSTITIIGASVAGAPLNVSAAGSSNDIGSIVFSNSNGVSFGLNGSTITAAHNAITTARASTDAVGLNAALTAGPLAWTVNSAGISLNAESAAGTTSGFGGNLISGSMTHNTAGLNLSLSHPAWLTTAMQSNAATISNINISAGTTSTNASAFTLANSNGISFGLGTGASVGSITASYTVPGATVFSNSNNVSFGLNGSTVTATATFAQSGQAFSADASSTFQTLTFQDSNGVSFSNNAGALRITHGLQYTSATSAITSNALHTSASRVINIVAATNNTGGGTASLSSNVSFSNANGATFYTSAGGAIALSYSVPAGGGAAISAGANSQNTGTVSFANSNGVTFGLSNDGVMTASVAGASAGIAALNNSNTTYTSGTVQISEGGGAVTVNSGTGQRFLISVPATSSLSATGAVSLSTNGSTISIGVGTVTAYATSNTTLTSSGTINLNSLVLQGMGNVSAGFSNGSIVISGSGGGGGIAAGVSNVGNTAGNTGTGSTGTLYFAGSNSLTLSQATAAGATTIHFQPLMWALSGGAGISLSTTGSTIVIYTV